MSRVTRTQRLGDPWFYMEDKFYFREHGLKEWWLSLYSCGMVARRYATIALLVVLNKLLEFLI